MTVLDLISSGAAVIVRGHFFTVGHYVPELRGWELCEYGEVMLVVRDKVLATMIDAMWWPEAAA